MRFMRWSRLLLIPVVFGGLNVGLGAQSLDGFADAIGHWQNRYGTRDYPRYPVDATEEIADNILHWQRANGGWKENEDPARILSAGEWEAVEEDRNANDTSFDNRNVWPQVSFLAKAYDELREERYREGCLRGLRFVLAAQDPSGGWPHSWPDARGYRDHLTFADDVIPDQLSLLRRVAVGDGPFAWLPDELRQEAAEAVERGDAFILRTQVEVAEVPTVWAGQYTRNTLEPAQGRSFELPGLVSRESVRVVRYLMSLDAPSPEVIAAVENAVKWFKENQIRGWRMERFEIPPERFDYHTARWDRRLVRDPEAAPLWARFYDLETSEPFLANRDGRRVYRLEDVALERRTGYSWYGNWAQSLIECAYPAWRQKNGLAPQPDARDQ